MMKYKIIFSSTALNDIKEIKAWYNLQQKGLGKRFYDDIRGAFRSIKLNPHFSAIRYQNVRKALCDKFPYALHYEIDEENRIVTIAGVLHTSRESLT